MIRGFSTFLIRSRYSMYLSYWCSNNVSVSWD